ncbi:MAG: leucine-rich repeat domain-containing protein [Candidatus Methanomethylophilus sp.]|jgi:hypothetical protein|nr:leucine-rich repeat domain-containing protein [Methanomethylophilus sp.]MCI2092543.1 leucine-rich repeat domain-containing protein [Methanomethylophilus sp.]
MASTHLGRATWAIAAIAMLVCIAAVSDTDGGSEAAEAHSGTWGDLAWALDADGALTIAGEGPMPSMQAGQSPGASHPTSAWLAYSDSIKSVTVYDGVTSVGGLAFIHCSSLESVVLYPSVSTIGDFAFYDCSSLESVTIMGPASSIGMLAFGYCPALSVTAYPDTYALYSWPSGTGLIPIVPPELAVTSLAAVVGSSISAVICSDAGFTVAVSGCPWLTASGRTVSGTPTEAGSWQVAVRFLADGIDTGISDTLSVTAVSALAPTNSPSAGVLIFPTQA